MKSWFLRFVIPLVNYIIYRRYIYIVCILKCVSVNVKTVRMVIWRISIKTSSNIEVYTTVNGIVEYIVGICIHFISFCWLLSFSLLYLSVVVIVVYALFFFLSISRIKFYVVFYQKNTKWPNRRQSSIQNYSELWIFTIYNNI